MSHLKGRALLGHRRRTKVGQSVDPWRNIAALLDVQPGPTQRLRLRARHQPRVAPLRASNAGRGARLLQGGARMDRRQEGQPWAIHAPRLLDQHARVQLLLRPKTTQPIEKKEKVSYPVLPCLSLPWNDS